MTNLNVQATDDSAPHLLHAINLLKGVHTVQIQPHAVIPTGPKPPLMVVFPVAPNDVALAIRHAKWLAKLMPMEVRHQAIVAHDAMIEQTQIDQLIGLLKKCFSVVNAMHVPVPPNKKWPFAPNWAFQHVALQMAYRGKPWLWLEPDCVVMKPDWLRQLQAEYDRCGKDFMGPIVKGMGHMNGCAIYPSDLPSRTILAMSCQKVAFDYAMKLDIIKDCHDASSLMQHIWSVKDGVMSENEDGPPPIKVTEKQALKWIHRSAVIVHRVKDASLIELLEAGWNTPRVEVVVAHWRRPKNIPIVLGALKEQTVPIISTITDASDPENAVDTAGFDRVFTMPNMGAWNRIAIAGAYDQEYTLLLDDDVIPSTDMVETFLQEAKALNDQFSVLGFKGRRFSPNEEIATNDETEARETTDWLARVYFVKTRDLHWTVAEMRRIGVRIELPSNHFDVLMAYGIRRNTGHPCYVLPNPKGMQWDALPDNDAVWKQPTYREHLIGCLKKLTV